MRKMVFGRKLSRGRKSREALFGSLLKALVSCGEIITTKAKAKAVIGQTDKLITLAKSDSIASRRRVLAYLRNDRKITDDIFHRIVPAFLQRKGGYTKMVQLPPRRGDQAKMVRIKWSEEIPLREEKDMKANKKQEEKKDTKNVNVKKEKRKSDKKI